MVRIWNTSGDVSQGQGLFATDLVRAYAACEARLDALAAAKPGQVRGNEGCSQAPWCCA